MSDDLVKYGYAPGNYMGKCSFCQTMMRGVDKRCHVCKTCADDLRERHTAKDAQLAAQARLIERLRGALKQIEWSNDSAWQSQCAREALSTTPPDDGCVRVPEIPTEAMWGGLARDIMMWLDMYSGSAKTPRNLFKHLESVGRPAPQWLKDEPEMKNLDHVPSKGTRVAIIYRALLAEKGE